MQGIFRELHHLREEVLVEDRPVMVPAAAQVYAAAIGWRTPMVGGVDTTALHTAWWHAGHEEVFLQEHPWMCLLSEPVPLFKFDFAHDDPELGMPDMGFRELNFKVKLWVWHW